MEEKEQVKVPTKLTYEQLQNVAQQISAQAEALSKENKQLRTAVQQLSNQNAYTELGFRFKILKYSEFFNKDFVLRISQEIEQTMTPIEEEPKKEYSEEK